MSLDFDTLTQAVAGGCAAIRSRTRLQPAGGPGDKVFPPTYVADDKNNPLKYAHEVRRIEGQDVKVVLLDSVASQANRMEEALLAGWEAEELNFPVIGVDFTGEAGLEDLGFLTALQAPHRIADALLRDALYQSDATGAVPFRDSPEGREYTAASVRNATAVYRLCPTALVFGVWDSTLGGKGAKFQRALVSEIVGIGFSAGVKTKSRIDPAGIEKQFKIYHLATNTADWTADAEAAQMVKNAPVLFTRSGTESKGTPATINHGNIPPSIEPTAGGVTFDYATQTTVLSLPALRKLRFPVAVNGQPVPPDQRIASETAARTALAALALAAAAAQRQRGFDLRSRSLLVPEAESPLTFEFVPSDGGASKSYAVSVSEVYGLLREAQAKAQALGFGWQRKPFTLKPMPKLVSLIRESRKLGAIAESDAGGAK